MRNKIRNYRNVRVWRQNHKLRLVQCFGGKCAICKIEDHPVVYDFHHLDPGQKDFVVTGRIRAWKSVCDEAKKCVMLCVLCHRKVHIGLVEVPPDAQTFDESLATDGAGLSVFDKCGCCGGLKNSAQAACSRSCSVRLTSWARRNKHPGTFSGLQDLAELVRKNGYRKVAAEMIIQANTLRSWLEEAKIAPRFRKSRMKSVEVLAA